MSLSSLSYRLLILVGCCVLAIHALGVAATHAQTPIASLLIESNDPRVTPGGTWSSQAVAQASGGSYLFSSGADADMLTLPLLGSAIEIRYVAGPRLGTMAIEVDGTVLRTVITTATKTAYGQATTINYLTDEPHTLKVYAQAEGIIAVDAFIIHPSTPLLIPTTDSDGGIQSSPCAPPHATYRVSVNANGQNGNGESEQSALSADGRYVVFQSTANNLVMADNNFSRDIFVVDRLTCTISLVTVSSGGVQASSNSASPSISADGRYVAFQSDASNLVVDDNNGMSDIFVHDRQTKQTTRVSVVSGGGESNDNSSEPIISANGRYVIFSSNATNLVSGDTNAQPDVFVHDRQAGQTIRVSVATGGGQATGGISGNASISSDGRYIAFRSYATNLVAGDTNGQPDIFVYDRQEGQTTRVTVATDGGQTNSPSFRTAISGDGRYVVFRSYANNLVAGDTNGVPDIFVYDRQTAQTTRVSVATGGVQANGSSDSDPKISADGRYVVFFSAATNLVTGDTNGFYDAFVHDRQTNTTTRVSVANSGQQANDHAYSMGISADGHTVTFQSRATNLVQGDTNTFYDIFVAPSVQFTGDTLALFNPAFNQVNLLDVLTDNPLPRNYTAFSAYTPATAPGQWVMGDWNGDGLDTPGVYTNGAFFYTNLSGESQPADWQSLWIGMAGPPVAGRFNANLPNDCIGAVQSANFPPFGTAFVLYFTCDLSGNTTPAISNQWLSVILPDSGGFTGTHQFGAGDFNGDGVDSIAVRRGTFIAFGNVGPAGGAAAFDLAQFIGTPFTNDEGVLVVGDWNADGTDSFGLFYQNGEFFYRNDLQFNSGLYVNQSVGIPFAGMVQVATWR